MSAYFPSGKIRHIHMALQVMAEFPQKFLISDLSFLEINIALEKLKMTTTLFLEDES
ncbi:hypothetical protein LNI95_12025 [Tenacibaculum dicentrarchi]|nr:hypothetical protein [Tenacibaculum dicentrarchi]